MAEVKEKTGKETRVLPVDDIEVKWTGKDGFNKADSKGMVHKELAKKLAIKGFLEIVPGGESKKSEKPPVA